MNGFQEALRKFSDVLLLGVLLGISLVLVVPFGPMFVAGCRLARRSQRLEDTSFRGLLVDAGAAFRTPLTTVVLPSVLIALVAVDVLIITVFPVPNAGMLAVSAGVLIAALLSGATFAGMSWEPGIRARDWAAGIREAVVARPRRSALIVGASAALVVIVWAAPLTIIVMLGTLCLASTWTDAPREVRSAR